MTTIEIRGLTKTYGPVLAVDQLSFASSAGRVTGFLGANGSGKTTTLRILLGLADATSGTATFDGGRYSELRRPIRQVGAVIAPDTFHPGRTGANHLRVMAIAAGITTRRVNEILDTVGLADVAGRKVGCYSMGMRQRLSLAAALLGDPDVLILDEPLNGLDPEGISWTRSLLRQFAADGGTVLLSSHLLAEVSHTVDDVVVIAHGRLLAASSLNEFTRATVTIVHTPHAAVLTAALLAEGYPAQRMNEAEVHVPGAVADTVGLVAAHEGVVITGLSEQGDDLADLFHDLTNTEGAPS